MSNSLDPDQARQFVGPDLGPNCLPRLSADDTGRQRVKVHTVIQQCIDVQVSLINFLYSSAVLTLKHLCNVVGLQKKS